MLDCGSNQSINRTTFGIETFNKVTADMLEVQTINRTTFGIETYIYELMDDLTGAINRTTFGIETHKLAERYSSAIFYQSNHFWN